MIQFGRYASVTVSDPRHPQGTLITGLRITFKVLKDVTRVLNHAEIDIYGLSDATKALFSGVGASVLLQAGYVGVDGKQKGVGTIFYGDISGQDNEQVNAETIVHIQATDSYEQFRANNHEFTFAAGYSAIQALINILQVAGVVVEFPGSLDGFVPDKPFLTGWQYSGATKGAIERLASRLGLEFMMLDGKARFLIEGASTALSSSDMGLSNAQQRAKAIAPLISAKTGLIGSIVKHSLLKDTGKISKDPRKTEERHGWRFKCLLNPQLQPGSPVFLMGKSIPDGGAFRIDRLQQQGDTHGADWYSECITPTDALNVATVPPYAGGPDSPASGAA